MLSRILSGKKGFWPIENTTVILVLLFAALIIVSILIVLAGSLPSSTSNVASNLWDGIVNILA